MASRNRGPTTTSAASAEQRSRGLRQCEQDDVREYRHLRMLLTPRLQRIGELLHLLVLPGGPLLLRYGEGQSGSTRGKRPGVHAERNPLGAVRGGEAAHDHLGLAHFLLWAVDHAKRQTAQSCLVRPNMPLSCGAPDGSGKNHLFHGGPPSHRNGTPPACRVPGGVHRGRTALNRNPGDKRDSRTQRGFPEAAAACCAPCSSDPALSIRPGGPQLLGQRRGAAVVAAGTVRARRGRTQRRQVFAAMLQRSLGAIHDGAASSL
jgi:hypothetical protein